MSFRATLPTLLLLALLLPAGGVAQRITGRVVEEGSGAPIPGAFLVLLDGVGDREDAGLSDTEGFFLLEAADPGVYRIRVDRIGYRSTTAGPFTLDRDGLGGLIIEVASEAIRLDPIEVEGARRCVLRPEEGQPTYRLWAEARKGLEIAEWVDAEDRFVYDVVLFRRVLEPRRMVVDSETVEIARITAREPFYVDFDARVKHGFVEFTDTLQAFHGADAALLLSDAFLDTHCFSRVDSDPERVGLAFHPVDPDAVGEIEGVLWLDRATAGLEHLEFRYVNAPVPVDVNPAEYGGVVRFHRMGDGAWIVSHWRIRSPVFGEGIRRVRHIGFTETEGGVLRVWGADGSALPFERVGARLTGRVVRRRGGDPVPGARVRILGTPYETVTDEDGYFGFEGLAGGWYRVGADGPGIRAVESAIRLERGATTSTVLGG